MSIKAVEKQQIMQIKLAFHHENVKNAPIEEQGYRNVRSLVRDSAKRAALLRKSGAVILPKTCLRGESVALRTQKRWILVDEVGDNAAKLQTDQIRYVRLNDEYVRFSKAAGLRTQVERAEVSGFGPKQEIAAAEGADQYYQEWSKSIGTNNSIKTLANYYDVKYTDSPRYELLQGYARAVKKGDISPLTGFAEYERTNKALIGQVVGLTAKNGITIESFTTHFIDRVIGQTATSHPGMRCGVPIEDVIDALLNPRKTGIIRVLDDGDIRQSLHGEKASVAMSIRDKRIIQTNP